MPDRFIRESALTSESLSKLSDFAERLFWRLTTIADDFGRFNANPAVVAGRTMPLVTGATAKKVESALCELHANKSIQLYEIDGAKYACFPSWSKHQLTRAVKSKFPDPPTSADNCLQVPTNDSTSNSRCSAPNTNTNTNTDDPDPDPDPDLSSEGESEGKPERPEPQDLADAWNEFCVPLGLPKVGMLAPSRKEKARLRLKDHPDPEFWQVVFASIRGSPFLLGHKNGDGQHKKWKVNFDWLIANDLNCVKIHEGKYVEEK